jgi:hypothetical protein
VGDTHTSQTFNFDFNDVQDGWVSGAADFPQAQAGAVGAFGAVQPLPAPLTTTKSGLYLRGTNVSGDLFLFQKRFFSGLAGLVTYTISLQLEVATSYQAGCTTGPGPATFVKAGVSVIEPVTTTDGQGVVRMNIDKGAGTAAGDFLQLGDIRNGLSGCPAAGTFGLKTTVLRTQPTTLTTGSDGGFWLFIGTQSSFAGQHEIYITGMKLVVE